MGDEQGQQQAGAPEDRLSKLRSRLNEANAALSRAQERIRRLERALAQQHDQYKVVFQASYLAEFLVDPDTDAIIDTNPRACLLYGVPRSKLLSMSFSTICQFTPATLQAITQGIHFSEEQIQLADGKRHTLEVFSGPLKMYGHTVIHVRISDITERKREEAQFRLLWQALHQSANSVVITDPQGNIEYVNPCFTQITGYTLDEVRGQNPRILKSGHTTPAEYQALWSTITAKGEWAGEFSNRKKNGETYWEEARIAPVLDERSDIVHFIAIKQDITQRKLAEQKLAAYNLNLENLVAERTAQFERLNERLNTILNNISSPVLLLDRQGTIINANRAFNRQMNSQPEEFFGRPLTSLFSQSSHPAVLKALQIAMTGEMPDIQQIQMTDHSGALIDAELTLNPVPNHQEHIVCTLHDISHLKEIERLKDEFVSMVSHELRTPVASLMLSAQLLRDYSPRLTPQDIQEKVAGMYVQAQQLSKLINSILDLSRLEARRGQKGNEHCDIARALHDVAVELTQQIALKRHHLDLQIEGNTFNLTGDQLDLERIWRNLLSNAIKYTPDGGRITARLYNPNQKLPALPEFVPALPAALTNGRYVVGLIEDNGRGIHPDELSTLFTRFNRGWAAMSNIPGTGLGLALVEEMLHLYGGDIAVATTLGQGSTFCFWIPLD